MVEESVSLASRIIELSSLTMSPSTAMLDSLIGNDFEVKNPLLRILLVFACPVGGSSLRLQSEERAIKEAVRQGSHCREVKIDVLPACTVDDLSNHLLQHPGQYNVIHFSGHADRLSLLLRNVFGKISAQHEDSIDPTSLQTSGTMKVLEAAAEVVVSSMEKLSLGSGLSSNRQQQQQQQQQQHRHTQDPTHLSRPLSQSAMEDDCSVGKTSSEMSESVVVMGSEGVDYIHSDDSDNSDDFEDDDYAIDCDDDESIEDDVVSLHSTPSTSARNGCSGSFAANSTSSGPVLLTIRRLFDEENNNAKSLSQKQAAPSQQLPLSFPSISTEYPFVASDLHLRTKSGVNIRTNFQHSFSYGELRDIGVGSLAFEGEGGRPAFVPPTAFTQLLSSQTSLHCVVLNACGSKIQGELLRLVVPITVCFEGKITDKESVSFSKGFYSALANGLTFEAAFEEGKRRIELGSTATGLPARPPHQHNSHIGGSGHGSSGQTLGFVGSSQFANLLVNKRILKQRKKDFQLIIHAKSVQQSAAYHSENPYKAQLRQLRDQVHSLRILNEALTAENAKFKSMMGYGVEMMQSKDKELASWKKQYFDLLNSLTHANVNAVAAGAGSTSPKQSSSSRVSTTASPFLHTPTPTKPKKARIAGTTPKGLSSGDVKAGSKPRLRASFGSSTGMGSTSTASNLASSEKSTPPVLSKKLGVLRKTVSGPTGSSAAVGSSAPSAASAIGSKTKVDVLVDVLKSTEGPPVSSSSSATSKSSTTTFRSDEPSVHDEGVVVVPTRAAKLSQTTPAVAPPVTVKERRETTAVRSAFGHSAVALPLPQHQHQHVGTRSKAATTATSLASTGVDSQSHVHSQSQSQSAVSLGVAAAGNSNEEKSIRSGGESSEVDGDGVLTKSSVGSAKNSTDHGRSSTPQPQSRNTNGSSSIHSQSPIYATARASQHHEKMSKSEWEARGSGSLIKSFPMMTYSPPRRRIISSDSTPPSSTPTGATPAAARSRSKSQSLGSHKASTGSTSTNVSPPASASAPSPPFAAAPTTTTTTPFSSNPAGSATTVLVPVSASSSTGAIVPSSGRASSAGLREFIRERRMLSSQCKPSASFKSAVRRFETMGSGADGSTD